ncbi:MAG: ExbD/TolR family protein [Thermodesulfobacteriota bacterium]
MKIDFKVERKARIEMIPVVDMIFLLLVFFVYAMLSMAVHHALPVDLPVSETARIDQQVLLSVTVLQDGTLFLDKEPVNLEALAQKLKDKTVGRRNAGLLLFADNRLTYQKLFNVIDRIKAAGINRISLEAEKER